MTTGCTGTTAEAGRPGEAVEIDGHRVRVWQTVVPGGVWRAQTEDHVEGYGRGMWCDGVTREEALAVLAVRLEEPRRASVGTVTIRGHLVVHWHCPWSDTFGGRTADGQVKCDSFHHRDDVLATIEKSLAETEAALARWNAMTAEPKGERAAASAAAPVDPVSNTAQALRELAPAKGGVLLAFPMDVAGSLHQVIEGALTERKGTGLLFIAKGVTPEVEALVQAEKPVAARLLGSSTFGADVQFEVTSVECSRAMMNGRLKGASFRLREVKAVAPEATPAPALVAPTPELEAERPTDDRAAVLRWAGGDTPGRLLRFKGREEPAFVPDGPEVFFGVLSTESERLGWTARVVARIMGDPARYAVWAVDTVHGKPASVFLKRLEDCPFCKGRGRVMDPSDHSSDDCDMCGGEGVRWPKPAEAEVTAAKVEQATTGIVAQANAVMAASPPVPAPTVVLLLAKPMMRSISVPAERLVTDPVYALRCAAADEFPCGTFFVQPPDAPFHGPIHLLVVEQGVDEARAAQHRGLLVPGGAELPVVFDGSRIHVAPTPMFSARDIKAAGGDARVALARETATVLLREGGAVRDAMCKALQPAWGILSQGMAFAEKTEAEGPHSLSPGEPLQISIAPQRSTLVFVDLTAIYSDGQGQPSVPACGIYDAPTASFRELPDHCGHVCLDLNDVREAAGVAGLAVVPPGFFDADDQRIAEREESRTPEEAARTLTARQVAMLARAFRDEAPVEDGQMPSMRGVVDETELGALLRDGLLTIGGAAWKTTPRGRRVLGKVITAVHQAALELWPGTTAFRDDVEAPKDTPAITNTLAVIDRALTNLDGGEDGWEHVPEERRLSERIWALDTAVREVLGEPTRLVAASGSAWSLIERYRRAWEALGPVVRTYVIGDIDASLGGAPPPAVAAASEEQHPADMLPFSTPTEHIEALVRQRLAVRTDDGTVLTQAGREMATDILAAMPILPEDYDTVTGRERTPLETLRYLEDADARPVEPTYAALSEALVAGWPKMTDPQRDSIRDIFGVGGSGSQDGTLREARQAAATILNLCGDGTATAKDGRTKVLLQGAVEAVRRVLHDARGVTREAAEYRDLLTTLRAAALRVVTLYWPDVKDDSTAGLVGLLDRIPEEWEASSPEVNDALWAAARAIVERWDHESPNDTDLPARLTAIAEGLKSKVTWTLPAGMAAAVDDAVRTFMDHVVALAREDVPTATELRTWFLNRRTARLTRQMLQGRAEASGVSFTSFTGGEASSVGAAPVQFVVQDKPVQPWQWSSTFLHKPSGKEWRYVVRGLDGNLSPALLRSAIAAVESDTTLTAEDRNDRLGYLRGTLWRIEPPRYRAVKAPTAPEAPPAWVTADLTATADVDTIYEALPTLPPDAYERALFALVKQVVAHGSLVGARVPLAILLAAAPEGSALAARRADLMKAIGDRLRKDIPANKPDFEDLELQTEPYIRAGLLPAG